LKASLIAGAALSTTSLAVVSAVLVEARLNTTRVGKLIMSACLSPTWPPRSRYRRSSSRPTGGSRCLFALMVVADAANGHAVLPAFVLGLVMARHYQAHRSEEERLRVVAFAFPTPRPSTRRSRRCADHRPHPVLAVAHRRGAAPSARLGRASVDQRQARSRLASRA
jgi:hypothetical protein